MQHCSIGTYIRRTNKIAFVVGIEGSGHHLWSVLRSDLHKAPSCRKPKSYLFIHDNSKLQPAVDHAIFRKKSEKQTTMVRKFVAEVLQTARAVSNRKTSALFLSVLPSYNPRDGKLFADEGYPQVSLH